MQEGKELIAGALGSAAYIMMGDVKATDTPGDLLEKVLEAILRGVPLVWKPRNNFRNVAVQRISDFQQRWGNSGPFDWFAAD